MFCQSAHCVALTGVRCRNTSSFHLKQPSAPPTLHGRLINAWGNTHTKISLLASVGVCLKPAKNISMGRCLPWKPEKLPTRTHLHTCCGYESRIWLRCYYVYSKGLMINARDAILHGLLLDNLQCRSPRCCYLPFCGTLFAFVAHLLFLSPLIFLFIRCMCGVI